MMFALGAAASAIDLLSSLKKSDSSSQTSSSGLFKVNSNAGSSSTTSNAASGSGGQVLSADTFATLLAAQSQSTDQTHTPNSASDARSKIFSKFDPDGDGQITKSEFEANLGGGHANVQAADRLFARLDQDSSGSINQEELFPALKASGNHGHHYAYGSHGAGKPNGSDPVTPSGSLLQAQQGASSTSSANSDGSTTTTINYADGSKVSLTSPATSASSSSASSSYNFVERLVQRQTEALSTAISV
jgi:hypothetical protein